MRSLENIERNETDLIAVANSYALSKKMSLTPLATRLLVWCISQIKKTDRDLVTFSLSSSNFIKSFGSTNVKRDMERITDELMDFQVRIQSGDTWQKINVMAECSYSTEEKEAKLTFNAKVWECFTNLSGGQFASGSLQIFTQINSRFAFNLYLFLHNHLKPTTITIDILELGELLGAIEPTYSKWAQLNSKILKPLQEAFDEHSPIKFKYRASGKVGRKYTKVTFYSIKKGQVQGQLIDEKNPCVRVEKNDDLHNQARLFWEGLSEKDKALMKNKLKEKGEPETMLSYDALCISSISNYPELFVKEGV